ncbi:hypothetical protein B1813_09200 [Saccharomonospora piscinae]|uniref:Uncharacterized protein n=1 Tax=Saccharomonospora piscinae TaxID=687388 RepID=A0A1V9A623_SACPI|nr:Rv3235 family protein [Saccharomonospora piscinae]OQO92374.1 hypothetical protein B1813_09200 [Saccharomonospora piscinae]TLW91910.1 hypothetical protein FFT09_13450 [Saccharomonospora piscinae]
MSHVFQSASGLLPLTPYEPTEPDDVGGRASVEVAEGQLTLDDLLTELHAQHAERHEHSIPAPGRRMVHRVLTALLEVYTGRRAASQLDGWLTPTLQRRVRSAPRAVGIRHVLRNIHVCRPADGALEVCGTAFLDERARALVARFEHGSSGWRCVLFTLLPPRN